MTTHSPVRLPKSYDPITERAAEYLQRRRFWDWSAVDQAELDAWLADSTLHRVAYLRLEGSVAYTEELVVLFPSELGLDLRKTVPAGVGAFMRHRFLFLFPLLAAASITLAALWGGPFIASLLQPSDRVDSTDVGGRTLLSFADRTQIELNTNTTVRTRMTTAERTVWLEKGEAWFHVAHDAAHPFSVIVGKHRITDMGTEFLIRRGADDVDVTLLTGRANLSAEGAQTATLGPDEEAVATAATLSVTRKTPQELADELAWRRGMLVFHNTPLFEVVREFNRYNTTKLVIADPAIAGEKITANTRTDNYENFLQLAEDVLKLRIDRKGSVILLSRGSREEMKKVVHLKHNL
jgi:transmembrane sensor